MRTEYSDKYIVLGLTIAYYRKKQDSRKKYLQRKQARV